MPKIDIKAAPVRQGSDYPAPFDKPVAERVRFRLGEAGGLSDFGVNLLHLPPGVWSSQRHWHSHEEEFVFVAEGEVVLVTDGKEEMLKKGDCAAFPKNVPNGHHLINRSSSLAIILEMGSRVADDVGTYSDIDMRVAGGTFMRKDGTPYRTS